MYTAHEDFQILTRNTLHFQPGDTVGTMRCVPMGIINDNMVEDDEYFIFELLRGSRTSQISEMTTRITILDDDGGLDLEL